MSKVVIVEYKYTDAFKIPKGLDLENKEQVKNWCVKWGSLWVVKTDGTELRISSECWDNDYKYPDYTVIENRDKYGIDYSDDDDEETEKNKN